MDWIEVTAKTVEDAKELALDRLGVVEDELEFEVLDEPKGGLFRRGDARIRARVKPLSREKPVDRRRRRGSERQGGRRQGSRGGSSKSSASARTAVADAPDDEVSDDAPAATSNGSSSSRSRNRRRGGRGQGGKGNSATRS